LTQGKRERAVAEFRTAIRLKPDYPEAHHNLGNALKDEGKLGEAILEWREAIRLKPDFALPHCGLGSALLSQGKRDEAVAEFRAAIRIKPDLVEARHNLGVALYSQGKMDEVITECRELIRLKPDFAEAHFNLSTALLSQGKLEDALSALRRAGELAPPGTPLAQDVPERIRQVEQQIALTRRLASVLSGKDKLGDPAEGLLFVQICYNTKRFATAARFWAEALQAYPKLADVRQTQFSYKAACAAALAAAGAGKDEPQPDDVAKTKLRGQALAWLKTDLAAWSKLLDSDPQSRPTIVQTLQHWKVDTDLSGVREGEALKKLPEPDRKQWQALWADVEALLKRAGGQAP
jgi:tetratricopeptide (TPR) repeat protein